MTTILENLKPVARVVSNDLTQREILRAEFLARLRNGRDRQIFAGFIERRGVCAMGLGGRVLEEHDIDVGDDPYDTGKLLGMSKKLIDNVITLNDDLQLPFPIIADALEFWWLKERTRAAKRAASKAAKAGALIPASGMKARRAETPSGSVHDSPTRT